MAQDSFISGLAESAATQGTSGLIGAGMGLLLQKHNDRRQINQQRKLTQMQEEANKRMGIFNREQQLQMWKDTNYGPQMEELEKAGLNPALIYGMGGAGGATTGNPGGAGVSAGSAPMGGGEIMGMMMNKAQIDLIKAQTENIQADTQNKPKTGANIEASTASLTQGIQNQKTQQTLTEVETQLKRIETNFNAESYTNRLNEIEINVHRGIEELKSAGARAEIDQATVKDKITTIQQIAIGSIIENTLKRAQITKTTAETGEINSRTKVNEQTIINMVHEIQQKWDALNQSDTALGQKEIELKQGGQRIMLEKWKTEIMGTMNTWQQTHPEIMKTVGGMIHDMKTKLDKILNIQY